ncbi:MAG: hypothetical protein ABEI52_04515, partial [Halobacteriaceae archaeon]
NAQDIAWATFQGDAGRTGTSIGTSGPADDLEVSWEKQVFEGEVPTSSAKYAPVVAGNALYVATKRPISR